MVTIYIKNNQFVKHVGAVEFYMFNINKDGEKEYVDHYILDGFTKIELEDKYSDCVKADFNEDLTFSVEKYNARKEQEKANEYEDLIVSKIRQRYNVNQELAILRQRDSKPQEFAEYNAYVEECKHSVKNNF